MATIHYRDARIYAGGYDLSGDHNQLGVAITVEMLDETSFGDTTRMRKGGLTSVEITGAGNFDAATAHVDGVLWGVVGTDDTVVTCFVNGITEGTATDLGFGLKGVVNKYDLKGDVGSLLQFDMAIAGRGIEA